MTPDFQFHVSAEDKAVLVAQIVPQLLDALDTLNGGDVSLADDFFDVLAMAAGMMLEADTHLKTPAKLRDGALTVARHIDRHAKAYRAEHEREGGPGPLHLTLQEPRPWEGGRPN